MISAQTSPPSAATDTKSLILNLKPCHRKNIDAAVLWHGVCVCVRFLKDWTVGEGAIIELKTKTNGFCDDPLLRGGGGHYVHFSLKT